MKTAGAERVEILDYLRMARRHLAVLAGVPVLAAVLAGWYVLANPRPYVASVYVAPPSLMGSQSGTYQGPAGAAQFANDFIATAGSPAVVGAAARRTRVSVGDIESGLSVQQVGLSSRVQVTYTARESAAARLVAVAVARQSLLSLFGSQVPIAEAAVSSATASLHDANQALAAFDGKHGGVPVGRQYTTLTTRIATLRYQKAVAESKGLTSNAARLAGRIATLEAQAAALAPLTGEHADLVGRQTAAANTLTATEQVLAQARAQLAAADPGQVRAASAQQVSRSQRVLTVVVPAVAVGVFLAIGLVALLEVIGRQRRERAHERLRVGRFPAAGPRPRREEPIAGPEVEKTRLEAAE